LLGQQLLIHLIGTGSSVSTFIEHSRQASCSGRQTKTSSTVGQADADSAGPRWPVAGHSDSRERSSASRTPANRASTAWTT
jgi:hypothetical protein